MVISLLTNNGAARGLSQTKVIWEQDPRSAATFAVPTGIDRREYLCTGTCVANLPTCASSLPNCMIGFKNTGTSTLTINANGSDRIDGAASLVLLTNQQVTLFNTGTAWIVVSSAGSYTPTRYTSLAQTITIAGALTLPHELGVTPGNVRCRLVCVTAELGYTAGQIIASGCFMGKSGAGAGVAVVPDATNLNVRFSNAAITTFQVINYTTGANTNITNTNWNVIFVAEP